MNKEDVSKLVISFSDTFGSTNRSKQSVLENQLRKAKSLPLFEGLFSVFLMQSSEHSFARQQNAGVMLHRIKPKVKLKPFEMLRLCLPTWNVSVEELVFYFVEKCGKNEIATVLNQLERSSLSARELDALKGMYYWFEKLES